MTLFTPPPPPPLSQGLINSPPQNGLLRALGRLPVVEGMYFLDREITLDGYLFRRCRFDKCTLLVYSSNFEIDHCVIDTSCHVKYGPVLVKALRLFTSQYTWWPDGIGFSVEKNPDGTVSIAG